jgi:hypothetical protein
MARRGRWEAARRAAANFQVGDPLHFEEVSIRFEEVSRTTDAFRCDVVGVAHVSLADVADAYLYLGPIDSLTLAEPPGEP